MLVAETWTNCKFYIKVPAGPKHKFFHLKNKNMNTLALGNLGVSELNRLETFSIDGGDSNGTMAGEHLSLEWTSRLSFVFGVFHGFFG